VAARAGVSRSLVSVLERGHLDGVTIAVVRRVAQALGIRLDLVVRWRAGDLDRLLNAGHAALHEEIARYLGSLPDWLQAPEVSFSIFGERGVIDILAFHPSTGSLLVIELKTELADLEEMLTVMDRRVRLAGTVARERGWEATSVSCWVVIADGDANRRRVQAHAATLRSAFPANGHEMRAWFRAPAGRIAGLSFWANASGSSATRKRVTRKRVRATATRVGAYLMPLPVALAEDEPLAGPVTPPR
jgi:transcriptional regulator with XRE-family HTH domain